MQVWCSNVFKFRRRPLIAACTFIAVIGFLLVASLCIQLARFVHQPLLVGSQSRVVIDFPPGSSLMQLADRLTVAHLITKHDKKWFILLVTVTRNAHRLQSGEYVVKPSMTVGQLLQKIITGHVLLHKITFPEGIVVGDMFKILAEHPQVIPELVYSSPEKIRQELGITSNSIEGVFYPDTYLFPKGTSDKLILKQSLEKMRSVVAIEWADRSPNLRYQSPYEALIAASLVEKETANEHERYRIAGVLSNRLRLNMLLQIDPTVIYGMGSNYKGELSRADLKYDSPYNTYLYRGLPPSPIALTRQASVHAVLHPLMTDDLYYVSQGDGTHLFATSLNGHIQNIQRVKQRRLLESTYAAP